MASVGVHKITVGDTLRPLKAILRWNGTDPIDLASYTVKFFMELENGTSELAATSTGVTAHPTQAFTASATTDLLTCNAHGVKENDQIGVASSGTLPTGLSSSARYFAVQVGPNTFSLALTPRGSVVDITGAGSGSHTFYIVGSVQYTFLAANVDTAQVQRGWFTLTSGSSVTTIPEGDRWIEINVVSIGN